MSDIAIASTPFDSATVRGLLDEWDARLPAGMRGRGPVVRAGDFAAPGGVFLVARERDGAVGCAGLRALGAEAGELKRLYVRPPVRGRGVARALVQAIEAYAVRLGYRELRLDTHSEATAAVFRALGFQATPDYNGNPNARHWFAKTLPSPPAPEAGARAWWWARQLALSEEVRLWDRGVVVRSPRHPTYHELNKAVVERASGAGASELAAEIDALLPDADYRRLDVLELAEAARLRPELAAVGFRAMALSIMHLEEPSAVVPPGPEIAEVDLDAVVELRRAWHAEDEPGGSSFSAFYPHYREVALARGARVLAVCEWGRPVGYAQLEGTGDARPGVEIGEVYVGAAHRGRGLGTALTAAAIAAAGDRGDVWIAADAEDRPRHLYERLGFRPAWGLMEFVRPPS